MFFASFRPVSLTFPSLQRAVLVGAREVAAASAKLMGYGEKVAENPRAENKQTMNEGFKAISNAMGVLVRAIKDADVGDKAARDAASEISRVQADLDAALIFAETGQLHLGAEKRPLAVAHEEFTKAVPLRRNGAPTCTARTRRGPTVSRRRPARRTPSVVGNGPDTHL